MLGISRRTLRRWCAEGKLTYVQFGQNKIGFRRQLLEHFIRSHEVRGAYHVEVVGSEPGLVEIKTFAKWRRGR